MMIYNEKRKDARQSKKKKWGKSHYHGFMTRRKGFSICFLDGAQSSVPKEVDPIIFLFNKRVIKFILI